MRCTVLPSPYSVRWVRLHEHVKHRRGARVGSHGRNRDSCSLVLENGDILNRKTRGKITYFFFVLKRKACGGKKKKEKNSQEVEKLSINLKYFDPDCPTAVRRLSVSYNHRQRKFLEERHVYSDM